MQVSEKALFSKKKLVIEEKKRKFDNRLEKLSKTKIVNIQLFLNIHALYYDFNTKLLFYNLN